MRLKKNRSLRSLTITLLICGLNFDPISENEVENFQGALEVISNAARTSVSRSNPLPSQCRLLVHKGFKKSGMAIQHYGQEINGMYKGRETIWNGRSRERECEMIGGERGKNDLAMTLHTLRPTRQGINSTASPHIKTQ